MRPDLRSPAFLALLAAPLGAQWDPPAGLYGKAAPGHLRVMTWNVEDGLCRTNAKDVPSNNWAALARIVAALQPDVLVVQEAGDNEGNGTGDDVDTVSELLATLGLFLHGGADPFEGGSVTEYVAKYAPGYDLPYLFVSADDDGFNRNAILSRHPFQDLNGDGKATLSNVPTIQSHLYVAGTGQPGPRGTPWAEIDLPDATYPIDLVIACSHLKAGSTSSDQAQRIDAGQRIAYYIDYLLNGGAGSTPDPFGKVSDVPAAASTLETSAMVVHAGDFNDKVYPAPDGVRWSAWAANADGAGAADGPDADRSDMAVDDAREFFTQAKGTLGATKLDYVTYEDSLANAANEFVFSTGAIPAGAFPAALQGFFSPAAASSIAADHLPVVVDFSLPSGDCDGDGLPDGQEPDFDGDGAIDDCDNCPLANPDQADGDGDGLGDACESFFCHAAFGTGNSMQLSFCGDAFSTQGEVALGPPNAPGFVIVSPNKLPVPLPLLPGTDDLLIFAPILVPFVTGPGALATPLPGPLVGGSGPAVLLWYVQVAVIDPVLLTLHASNGVEVAIIQ
jgi:endonuclease/exonuclease/phosphatase family metal-dependent hydrolase